MSTLTDTTTRTYTMDPSHSRVGFAVRHMGFSTVRGSFAQFAGTVRMTPGDLASLSAEATVRTDSITTSDEKRDAHLRSADFFEVETYPTITFASTEVVGVSGDTFRLGGTLTMHGVSKPVLLEGTFLGEGKDPWGGTRVALEARTTVNRKDFGLNWNALLETGGVLVSEKVEIVLEVQAVQQAEG